MNLKVFIASKYTPAFLRAKASSDMFLELATTVTRNLREKLGSEGDGLMSEIMRQVGRKLALNVKRDLGVGNNIEDLVQVWKIVCNLAGVKCRVNRDGKKFVFHHESCPMWDFYRANGEILCHLTCIPMVRGLSEEIFSGADIEVVQEPTLSSPCVKSVAPKAQP